MEGRFKTTMINLKHFSPSEFQDPDKMNPKLLRKLDVLREYLGLRIIITSSTGGVHVANSQHYLGNAVDIVVPDWKGSLFSLYLIIERFNFAGLGLYPRWSFKGAKIGGFHLDERDLIDFQGKRWIGIPQTDERTGAEKTFYLPLNMPNLIKTGIVSAPNSSK